MELKNLATKKRLEVFKSNTELMRESKVGEHFVNENLDSRKYAQSSHIGVDRFNVVLNNITFSNPEKTKNFKKSVLFKLFQILHGGLKEYFLKRQNWNI